MVMAATEGQYTDEMAPPPAPSPAVPPSPQAPPAAPDYSSKIQGFAEKLYGTPEQPGQMAKEADALRAKRDATTPLIEDFKKVVGTPLAVAPPGNAPAIPPPPSKGLHAFAATVDGESPMASLQKIIAATGALATGLGMGGRSAKASLAAINGAMKGWAEGDKERADRAVADWKNQTDAALTSLETQSTAYKEALTAKNLDLADRLTAIKLTAAEHDNNVMIESVTSQGLQGAIDTYSRMRTHADQLQLNRDRLTEAMAAKAVELERRKAADEQRAQYQADVLDFKREQMEAKREAEKAARDELEAAYTPEVIRPIAIDFATKGKLPPNIARGKSGQFLIPKITADAVEWAKENGIDPNTFPSLQANIKSAGQSLTKIRGVNAVQEGSIKRMEGHFAKLRELSEKVDRSERPVIARYQLKSRGQYAGDPDVAAYETAAFESSMELAKMVVGSAQGDAATRDHARQAIDSALNKRQLDAVLGTLEANAKRNIEINRRSEADAIGVIDAAMKPGAKAEKIKVLRKSDKQPGTIDAKDFNPALYEKVGG